MTSAIIVAKGPTAKYIKKNDWPNHILVAINQACIFIDEIDYVFMNDIEALDGLSMSDIRKTKYFVIPEWPHKQSKIDIPNTSYVTFQKKLHQICGPFEPPGIILHNLFTSPIPNPSLPCTDVCISTVETAISFLAKHNNVKYIDTFGYNVQHAMKYHQDLHFLANTNHTYKTIINHGYDEEHMKKIKICVGKLKEQYQLSIEHF